MLARLPLQTVWLRVPATQLGTLFFAAWVCNDGQHTFLDPDPTKHQDGCWTNDGWTGTATWAGCGASYDAYGNMTLYGSMKTTARINIPHVPYSYNLETNDKLQDLVFNNCCSTTLVRRHMAQTRPGFWFT